MKGCGEENSQKTPEYKGGDCDNSNLFLHGDRKEPHPAADSGD